MRTFDIRAPPTPVHSLKVGSNYAISIDVKDNLILTSHRGFNSAGSDVKLWDLHKLEAPLWTFDTHEATPIAKFVNNKIATAGQDS